MIKENSLHKGKTAQGKTGEGVRDFTVLYMEGSVFKREKAQGRVISADKAALEISTNIPLQPRQALYWICDQNKDILHVAMVKWAKNADGAYRAGLSLL